MNDLVSIIIPTYRRLAELQLAVQSALMQTYPDIEVIVVSDGPDPQLRAALENMHPKLRYLELETNSGPAEARNRGVRESRGEWLTFLDDDDLMLPEKVEHQLRVVDAHNPAKMVSCRTIYRHNGHDDIWPERPIAPGEDIGDYVLIRPSLLGRPGVIPVQTLLLHRSLLNRVPFTTHKDHEDWAWLLEIWHETGARIEFVWKALVVYNIETEAVSRSRRMNWKDSFAWADRYRTWLSKDAYNSFLSTKVALKAKRAGDWAGVRQVARTVLANHPRLLDALFVTGITLFPGFILHAAWKRSLSSSAKPANVAREAR